MHRNSVTDHRPGVVKRAQRAAHKRVRRETRLMIEAGLDELAPVQGPRIEWWLD